LSVVSGQLFFVPSGTHEQLTTDNGQLTKY